MNRIIETGARIELARREFYYFCQYLAPEFYKPDRKYLHDLCNALQSFYEQDKEDLLIINLPPRFGKSRTAGLFTNWIFGKNQKEKIMTGSYNEILSTAFSKSVRNTIQEEKADFFIPVYSDVFPNVKIKYGDGAMNLWSLEGGHNNYLATSPGGTATGFGCSILIIDDLIKNADEANNELTLDKHWDWFSNTMLSRVEQGGKIIIIMTRWATRDLAGRIIEHYKENNKPYKLITMKALQDDGTMLCDEILSRESYEDKIKTMGADISSANYQQIPIDIKGKLYSRFKTYDKLPIDEKEKIHFTRICSYTDTADTGDDYLCSIIYGEYDNEAYILDVYYTKEPMEKTEPEIARRLYEFGVNVADIESNNGGRGFARNVESILKNAYKSNKTVIRWFHQSQNKKARILSNSTWVMEHIYFPVNWKNKWPEYYKAMNKYQKEGKNAHDDAPDATTGIAEKITGKNKATIMNKSILGL